MLGIPNVRGYNFDVQIVTAPVTDGSLSSCPPAEAVTWGKVDKDTYQQATESMQADYSTVMPFLVKALLDNRKRYAEQAAEIGEEKLFERNPRPVAICVRAAAIACSSSARNCAAADGRREGQSRVAARDAAISAGCALEAATRWDRR